MKIFTQKKKGTGGYVRLTCIVNIFGGMFTPPEISTYNNQWFLILVSKQFFNEKLIKYRAYAWKSMVRRRHI